MRLRLIPHPDTPCPAVERLEVEAERRGDVLELDYVLTGATERLRIPAPTEPQRQDGLWQHSCFEAFLRPGEGPAYAELNLSPSSEWAAYRLESYRAGMQPLPEVADPGIDCVVQRNGIRLRARLQLGSVPLLAGAPWRVGLSAIVERDDGTRTFWALAHPPGEPDFHHTHCFAAALPAAGQP